MILVFVSYRAMMGDMSSTRTQHPTPQYNIFVYISVLSANHYTIMFVL